MANATTVDVLDLKGKKAGTAELPADLFDVDVNVPLIHQVRRTACRCSSGHAQDEDPR